MTKPQCFGRRTLRWGVIILIALALSLFLEPELSRDFLDRIGRYPSIAYPH